MSEPGAALAAQGIRILREHGAGVAREECHGREITRNRAKSKKKEICFEEQLRSRSPETSCGLMAFMSLARQG